MEIKGNGERKGLGEGSPLLFLGEECPLRLRVNEGRKRTKIAKLPAGIYVLLGEAILSEKKEIQERHIREQLYKWYRKQAGMIIEERVRYYAAFMGEEYGQIRIKDQKSCWGSCSGKRNLNFNWHLVLTPMEILDYVVVHELCHLKQMNHSMAFWKEVEKILPDYKERRKWLRVHEKALLQKIS